jgi:FixJ family two-component response regulator
MPSVRKLVAVIDDDASMRRALDRQMRAAGFRCELFSSAEDFLAVAGELHADCIVSDINLGGMSGLELAMHPTVVGLNVPTVLITGRHDALIEERAQVIAAALLLKPIPPGKLLEAIIDAVGPPLAEIDD